MNEKIERIKDIALKASLPLLFATLVAMIITYEEPEYETVEFVPEKKEDYNCFVGAHIISGEYGVKYVYWQRRHREAKPIQLYNPKLAHHPTARQFITPIDKRVISAFEDIALAYKEIEPILDSLYNLERTIDSDYFDWKESLPEYVPVESNQP